MLSNAPLLVFCTADWVNPDMTLREQGIVESEILTIKQRIFLDKSSETIDNPIVRNMQYEQVRLQPYQTGRVSL